MHENIVHLYCGRVYHNVYNVNDVFTHLMVCNVYDTIVGHLLRSHIRYPVGLWIARRKS